MELEKIVEEKSNRIVNETLKLLKSLLNINDKDTLEVLKTNLQTVWLNGYREGNRDIFNTIAEKLQLNCKI